MVLTSGGGIMKKRRLKYLRRFLNPMILALTVTVLVYVIVRVSPSGKLNMVDEYWLLTLERS
jgi:hypothetical protein